MSYVEEQLRPGERIVQFTTLHWVVYVWPAILAVLTLPLIVTELVVIPLVALLLLGLTYLRVKNSEFAVTNRRVMLKTGIVSRKSFETLLSKVEGLDVDQSILGRMLNYGNVSVRGTGGGGEAFRVVSHPMELRRAIQDQIEAGSSEGPRDAVTGVSTPAARSERPCPWCAEPILAAARVCKHCQREVEIER